MLFHDIGIKCRRVKPIAITMCSSTRSTWSLSSHSFGTPSFGPFPNSIKVTMFFLSRINHISNIGDSDRSLGDVSWYDKFPCSWLTHLKYLVLLFSRQRRVKLINDKARDNRIMSRNSTVLAARFFLIYVIPLYFFFIIIFGLMVTVTIDLHLESSKFHF